MNVGRNELCPCGSGKKSKHCCNQGNPSSRWPAYLVLFVLLVGAAAIVAALREDSKPAPSLAAGSPVRPAAQAAQTSTTTTTTAEPATTPAAEPPGPAPAGKVWSSEHGHYHDAPNALSSPVQVDMGNNSKGRVEVTPQAKQPGQPVPGMVWSAEHGHYHRADGTSAEPAAAPPQAPPEAGLAPPGQVWSPEHGHYHEATLPEEGSRISNLRVFPQGRPPQIPQPAGPVPAGKVWSPEHGHWHDAAAPATTTNP